MSERVSARVLLVDEASRVLLVCSRDPGDGRVVWYAPGGAVEDGESLEIAARREIQEETGLELRTLIGPVWERRFPHTFDGRFVAAHEWFFLAHVRATDVHEVAETGIGARYFEGWRWWTVDELAAHDGILGPGRLAELLPPLLQGSLPAPPELLTD
jgi:8-oxo-dGTP pyrophosphatase MutT (NUDIX family)